MEVPRFSRLMTETLRVLERSDALFREHWARPRVIRHKGVIDLVTETDVAVENFLKQNLKDVDPSASFLAEESVAEPGCAVPAGRCWIIDPVDGTTNFAHGIPLTATSVALWDEGAVQFGVVTVPVWGQVFAAERGRGAWLNGERLAVSRVDACAEALVETGFPYTVREDMPFVLHDLKMLLSHCVGVRRGGSAALDLCWVAAGHFDGYFECGLKPWDVAAGWLMVEEAGGRVSARDGAPYVFHGPILATNGLIHDEMQRILAPGRVD